MSYFDQLRKAQDQYVTGGGGQTIVHRGRSVPAIVSEVTIEREVDPGTILAMSAFSVRISYTHVPSDAQLDETISYLGKAYRIDSYKRNPTGWQVMLTNLDA